MHSTPALPNSANRPRATSVVARLALALLLAGACGGCASSHSEAPAKPQKRAWYSPANLWPWRGSTKPQDATAHLEYHRTRSEKEGGLYTLTARNSHPTKTVVGQMRTTMETAPNQLTLDAQSFTLGPNEEKRLLVYPSRFRLSYEVTAVFRK